VTLAGLLSTEPADGPLSGRWWRKWWAFCACSAVALAAIWLHPYPAGVDLPQHANLFRLWADLGSGPFEYRYAYRVEWLTPYLLPYLTALVFTKAFGAMVATKLLLSIMALATPLAMRRWLSVIGADPAFGLVGFVAAFDYWYLWGFISCALATPLMFAYLTAFESQGSRPNIKAIAVTAALAVLLFFSHGITFGVSVLTAGLTWLVRGRWWRTYRAVLHLLPLTALVVWWTFARKEHTSAGMIGDWFDKQRAIHLFSGSFVTFPDQDWALVGAGGVALFLLLCRPKLRFTAARAVPFAVAMLGFVALPDWLASTWLVGTRFSVFIHAFAVALLVRRNGDVFSRASSLVFTALVLTFLGLLNVRLAAFNRELTGFRAIAAQVPKGADVQTLVPETVSRSRVFGDSMLGQIPAWITAEQGGLIANDSAVAGYYQIPIRRNDVPTFQPYSYVIAHGRYEHYRWTLRRLTQVSAGSAELLDENAGWILLRRPRLETDAFEVVRYSQGWGELRIDRNVSGGDLSLGGSKYAHGLGTHAPATIRLRLKRPGESLVGGCGVDDDVNGRGRGGFRVRRSNGTVVFDSGELVAGAPVRRFAVPLSGEREVVLEAYPTAGVHHSHADWVDLARQ